MVHACSYVNILSSTLIVTGSGVLLSTSESVVFVWWDRKHTRTSGRNIQLSNWTWCPFLCYFVDLHNPKTIIFMLICVSFWHHRYTHCDQIFPWNYPHSIRTYIVLLLCCIDFILLKLSRVNLYPWCIPVFSCDCIVCAVFPHCSIMVIYTLCHL